MNQFTEDYNETFADELLFEATVMTRRIDYLQRMMKIITRKHPESIEPLKIVSLAIDTAASSIHMLYESANDYVQEDIWDDE